MKREELIKFMENGLAGCDFATDDKEEQKTRREALVAIADKMGEEKKRDTFNPNYQVVVPYGELAVFVAKKHKCEAKEELLKVLEELAQVIPKPLQPLEEEYVYCPECGEDITKAICEKYGREKGEFEKIRELIEDGLLTGGGHHKQWYLEEIAKALKIEIKEEHEEGIAP